jgi:predicted ribosome quality control (RQC) complex YloA/Tae2 family protein
MKKGRFIQAYQKSRTETFTPRILRAGWATAGLFPWNPNKTLNSSQLHKINSSKSINPTLPSPNPPSTPTKRERTCSSDNSNIFRTPKHPRDIHESIKRLDNLTRDQCNIMQKAKKALGQFTSEQTKLQAANQRLEHQLEELQNKKRKSKITVDPNTLVANVDRIKQALEQASKARQR